MKDRLEDSRLKRERSRLKVYQKFYKDYFVTVNGIERWYILPRKWYGVYRLW